MSSVGWTSGRHARILSIRIAVNDNTIIICYGRLCVSVAVSPVGPIDPVIAHEFTNGIPIDPFLKWQAMECIKATPLLSTVSLILPRINPSSKYLYTTT